MIFLLIRKYVKGENVDLYDGFITIVKAYVKMAFYLYIFLFSILLLNIAGIISL